MAVLGEIFERGVAAMGVARGAFVKASKVAADAKAKAGAAYLRGVATCAVEYREAGLHLSGAPQRVTRQAKECLAATGQFGKDSDARQTLKAHNGIRKAAGYKAPGKLIATAVKAHGDYTVKNILLAFETLGIKSQNNLENFTGITLTPMERIAKDLAKAEQQEGWEEEEFLKSLASYRAEYAAKLAA